MKYKANCKLNLHLKITEKREDGYHNLETIFTEIPFYDELEITIIDNNDIILEEQGLEIPFCFENICVTAAKLLRAKSSRNLGCKIILNKKVPMGGGLGGGSSDAATVLKVLNKLWNLDYSNDVLKKIAVKIGADVPFFIDGGASIGRGIGDVLQPIENPLKSGYLVIINDGTHISTKKAYKKIKKMLTSEKKEVKLSTLLEGSGKEWSYKLFENDFESYAFYEYPELKKIKDTMYERGAYLAGMTGSGSTIFGCFENEIDVSWFDTIGQIDFIKVLKIV